MKFLLLIPSLLFLNACSTISKSDCSKDMYRLGFEHGKSGNHTKRTAEIQKKCTTPDKIPNLLQYEKGFEKGWEDFCLPSRAYRMGQLDDKYVSYCPVEREHMFREKYLLGKRYNDLRELEEDINDKIQELRKATESSSSRLNEIQKLQKHLAKVKHDIQLIEIDAKKDNFYFSNPTK